MRVHRSEFRFYPFNLTDKNEIPVKIVKELVTDGYAVMMISESTVNYEPEGRDRDLNLTSRPQWPASGQ